MVFQKRRDDESIEITSVEGEELTDEAPQEIESDIYVMPKEYYDPIVREKKHSRTYLIIGIVLLVIAAFAGAAFYVFYFQTPTPILEETTERESSEEVTSNVSTSDSATTTDSDINEPDGVDSQDDAEVITTDSDTEDSADTFFEIFGPLPDVLDSDGDGLTEVEETLLGTNTGIVDSDGDSFEDGAELIAGYDPTLRSRTLRESELFQTYINEADPLFTIDLPQAWKLQESDSESVRTFVAPNGDTIIIELFQNRAPFTFDAWFEDTYPGTDRTLFSQSTFGDFPGLVTTTGRQVIISVATHIVVLTYDVGQKSEVAYPHVWEYALSTLSRGE